LALCCGEHCDRPKRQQAIDFGIYADFYAPIYRSRRLGMQIAASAALLLELLKQTYGLLTANSLCAAGCARQQQCVMKGFDGIQASGRGVLYCQPASCIVFKHITVNRRRNDNLSTLYLAPFVTGRMLQPDDRVCMSCRMGGQCS